MALGGGGDYDGSVGDGSEDENEMVFFFNDTATTEIYPLSLHDALPIFRWFMSSANRDPNKFENPNTMDITRWPNPHVAFGSGVHHCLGATIARVEGQEVFSALAERYPNLQLKTHDMEYQESITFRSIKGLPVSLN